MIAFKILKIIMIKKELFFGIFNVVYLLTVCLYKCILLYILKIFYIIKIFFLLLLMIAFKILKIIMIKQ